MKATKIKTMGPILSLCAIALIVINTFSMANHRPTLLNCIGCALGSIALIMTIVEMSKPTKREPCQNNELLTADHLLANGFSHATDGDRDFFIEPHVKERDTIWVEFGSDLPTGAAWYRVWHGPNRTFIGVHSTKQWFDDYYKLMRENA